MPNYKVEWEIDIEAGSPEQAAKCALAIQRDTESTATVFKVWMQGPCPSCHCHLVHRKNCSRIKKTGSDYVDKVFEIDAQEKANV